MHRAHLPILLFASPAAQALLGRDVADVGVLALKAILRNRRGIEIAHQQIKYRKHTLAFSSRVGREGDVIVDLDVGVPGLDNRLVLETDLRRAATSAGANAGERALSVCPPKKRADGAVNPWRCRWPGSARPISQFRLPRSASDIPVSGAPEPQWRRPFP
jgi:hypothetical protein